MLFFFWQSFARPAQHLGKKTWSDCVFPQSIMNGMCARPPRQKDACTQTQVTGEIVILHKRIWMYYTCLHYSHCTDADEDDDDVKANIWNERERIRSIKDTFWNLDWALSVRSFFFFIIWCLVTHVLCSTREISAYIIRDEYKEYDGIWQIVRVRFKVTLRELKI